MMYRIVPSIAFIISLGILFSCSSAENTAQQPDQIEVEEKKYPSWYPEDEVVSEKNVISSYAAAIGEDSASAVSKAVNWAEAELQSAVSEKLENIRTEVLEENGPESGLDAPEFLIDLRETKDVVSPLTETGNTEVRTVEGFDSYHSFAEVSVPKDKLIAQIDERLADHEQAWNTMKQSKAFESF